MEPLQCKLLENNEPNLFRKEKIDFHIANEKFLESLNKESPLREQNEVKKLNKLFQVMGVEVDVQRGKSYPTHRGFFGKQFEQLQLCLQTLLN